MSIVVEFTVPANACALGRSLGEDPSLSLELDRIIPTETTVMPFFWLWGSDCQSFANAAAGEPSIEELSIIDEVDDGALFRAVWNEDAIGTLRTIAETEGVLLDARANNAQWTFEVRFTDADQTSQFRSLCQERGVPLTVTRVTTSPGRTPANEYGLTPEQSEALTAAYRLGYFSEPRKATLEELADELGISSRAVAGRLRRGQATLLERTGLTGITADT
ncbi:helix-turn-helix domain-containing protein [Natronocalculus amylovorans]|uniref:Helix-turn-helix domain-containing protein n=1 Tax=Natronocalculus amylovorans TaxID=2917812 RepID=A0AAE3FW92_9EURY|nr:helix-turn-helix domain-containing protein [Natronocalculus amylovorans]MCL9816351.1 helix-turn-helix domain-containing protein [Natronocalculus amylovorans]NUE03442.1 helix-turn-helix domain-containing protein [Halorubraceae archaeon YAN]